MAMAENSVMNPRMQRYAVLGAGFAGVSVAWHLIQFTSAAAPITVEVFDESGIAAGASGASGGLLHPYSPSGKLVCGGEEGFEVSLNLLSIAEAYSSHIQPISWRRGILRPAFTPKHAANLRKNADFRKIVSATQVRDILPGLALPGDAIALHITEGINIDPKLYLDALWSACNSFASAAEERGCTGTKVLLRKTHISCLSDVPRDYKAVIICLGAKTALLPELKDKLPLSFCRGVVGYMHLPLNKSEQFEENTPSVLSSTWLAFQGQRRMLLGATKEYIPANAILDSPAGLPSIKELKHTTEQFYPGISEWELAEFRTGVRAVPPRTELGRLPLLGCLDGYFWIFTGLGSRGLVYHAWLGSKLANAVVLNNQEIIPAMFRKWQNKIIN